MSSQQALERMRHYLWTLVEQGAFTKHPELSETVLTALRSTNPEWISNVFYWVRVQPLSTAEERVAQEEVFREPRPQQLTGRIFVGKTLPSHHPVWLPLKSFGQGGHTLVAGTSGTGKSTLLNFVALQLTEHVPVTIYDFLEQSAPMLIPLVPQERLGVIDYKDYRRNFLLGPPHMSQLDWLRAASDHLMESLGLEPVTMNVLIQLCEEIIRGGRIATIPRILERLNKPGYQSPSHRSLQNRLLPLTLSGHEVFTCQRGFDLDQLLEKSVIFNLKAASQQVRRLIYHDQYSYLTRCREVLAQWKLKNVFVFHEVASFVSRSAIGKNPVGQPFFLSMIREARNYGIGFLFADQAPHIEHTVVRSNIGTRCLFRLEDDAALDIFKTTLGLNEEQRNLIMNLPDRQMVLRRPDIPFPFVAAVPALY